MVYPPIYASSSRLGLETGVLRLPLDVKVHWKRNRIREDIAHFDMASGVVIRPIVDAESSYCVA